MVKRFFVLVLALIACGVSAQETKVDSGPIPAPAKQPAAQSEAASGAGFKVIQEIAVPKEYMVMPGMKVSGDGSLVLYIVQIAGDDLEYAAMANTTRLTNKSLEVAKDQREKTGDTNISLDAADYRLTMIGDLEPSPLWQAVAYGAMTSRAGPVVLINALKAPDYASLYSVSGALPSWYAGTTGEMIAFFARKDNKIKLIADEEIALDDGALPVAAAIIRGKRKAYVVSMANRCSLYVDGKKVSEDYDAIEPAFFRKGTATDSTVAYIAKKGVESVLVVDGKVQTTDFVPAHDLVYAPGGDSYTYAAIKGGREFAVRNGARVTTDKDFAKVRWLTFDTTKTKLAYVARDGSREWVMINDRKVTPEYDLITFCREQFRINGTLIFAGLDAGKNSIVVGRLTEPAKADASGQK